MIAEILRLSTDFVRFMLLKLACAGDGGLQDPEAPTPNESFSVEAMTRKKLNAAWVSLAPGERPSFAGRFKDMVAKCGRTVKQVSTT